MTHPHVPVPTLDPSSAARPLDPDPVVRRAAARRRVRRSARWVAAGATVAAGLLGIGFAAEARHQPATTVGLAAGRSGTIPVTVSGGSAAVAGSSSTAAGQGRTTARAVAGQLGNSNDD